MDFILWRYDHEIFQSMIIFHYVIPEFIMFASTFKVLTGLLIWPDVDEGDLMDEEFDSESDA